MCPVDVFIEVADKPLIDGKILGLISSTVIEGSKEILTLRD